MKLDDLPARPGPARGSAPIGRSLRRLRKPASHGLHLARKLVATLAATGIAMAGVVALAPAASATPINPQPVSCVNTVYALQHTVNPHQIIAVNQDTAALTPVLGILAIGVRAAV